MAPKRKAGAAAPASKTKKPKSTSVKPAVEDASASALDTVQSTLKSVASAITDAVNVAGDLVLDDPSKTPVPVSEVVEQNVDVAEVKKAAGKAGKKAKGKAASAAGAVADKAAELESAAEAKLAEQGVDVKAAKGKAQKAAKGVKDSAEGAKPTVTKAVDSVKPLKGKAAKAAKEAQDKAEQLTAELNDPESKKRKTAEDFMHSAEETVRAVAGKVGEVFSNVVEGFGEASGLAADLGNEAKAGKEGPATKKVKGKVAEVKDKADEGVKQVKGKGKKVAEKAQDNAEVVIEQGKKKAKKIEEQAEVIVDDAAVATKTRGKKAAAEAEATVTDAKTNGKRKAKNAVAVVEPTAKKAKATAEDAAEAAAPVVAKGKKAAAAAADTVVAAGKKAGKVASAAAKAAAEAAQENDDVDMDGSDDEIKFDTEDEDGADSSDESDAEDVAVREAGKKVDMSSLPMVAKDDKSVAARLKKAHKKNDKHLATLYLGRIPHGFYEEQMKEYFSQFGDVTRLRLARNKKTGASKHYAYIEMTSQSVAEIVAETMNNYLLMGHLLKCQIIPQDEVHEKLWEGANKKFRKVPRARVEKARHERTRTKEEQDKSNAKVLNKQAQRQSKIKAKGIDYEYAGHE